MVYLAVLIILIYFIYQFDYCHKVKNRNISYCFILIVLIAIAGLRYRLGVDSVRYERMHITTPSLLELDIADFDGNRFDPLYLCFASFAKMLGDEFWILQLLHAAFINIVVFWFVKGNTKNIFTAIFLYYIFLYFPFLFEAMRESCAVAMVLLGWKYLKNDRWWMFLLHCILATLFHTSAIFFILFPLLKVFGIWKYIRINKYTVLLLILFFHIGNVIREYFFDYIILLNLSDQINAKASIYSSEKWSDQTLNLIGMMGISVRYVLYPIIAVYIIRKSHIVLNKNLEALLYISFVIVILSFNIRILYRYSNYLMPFSIIAIAECCYLSKMYVSRRKYLCNRYFALWLLVLFPISFLQFHEYWHNVDNTPYKTYMRYYPYSSIFTKSIDSNRENLFYYYNAY